MTFVIIVGQCVENFKEITYFCKKLYFSSYKRLNPLSKLRKTVNNRSLLFIHCWLFFQPNAQIKAWWV